MNENENLLVHADSICVVDWKDGSLPTKIPSGFNEGNCTHHLKTMLSAVGSIIEREAGIHNLGLRKGCAAAESLAALAGNAVPRPPARRDHIQRLGQCLREGCAAAESP